MASGAGAASVLTRDGLEALIETLRKAGYGVVGPTVRDGAIVYDEIAGVADLPEGTTDEQAPGRYRLARRGDRALFGYAVGPHSWKKYLFPASRRLFAARRAKETGSIEFETDAAPPPRLAFLGVRACEIAAMIVQDRVFRGGAATDPDYAARRDAAFVVAVQCAEPAGTCFCASMGTGPRAESGFDVGLTEIVGGVAGEYEFLAEPGSERGAALLGALPRRPADERDLARARRVSEDARAKMGRTLETDGIRELLARNPEHPRWDDVAARCLACANCTMACPTCFCSTVEDVTDLTGENAERWRKWDSCFSPDFSYVHGGAARPSTRARYRHWMTHKLSTWFDQFETSGCVGCGRCIAWCPVGIDLTEEARAIRASDGTLREERRA